MGNEEVLIAVDPTRATTPWWCSTRWAAVPSKRRSSPNTHAGYGEMVRFARRWRQRR
jgi:hypothetical protein